MWFLTAYIQSSAQLVYRPLTTVEPHLCRPRFTLDTFNEHGWLYSVQQSRTRSYMSWYWSGTLSVLPRIQRITSYSVARIDTASGRTPTVWCRDVWPTFHSCWTTNMLEALHYKTSIILYCVCFGATVPLARSSYCSISEVVTRRVGIRTVLAASWSSRFDLSSS
jgi:hypothetical protein